MSDQTILHIESLPFHTLRMGDVIHVSEDIKTLEINRPNELNVRQPYVVVRKQQPVTTSVFDKDSCGLMTLTNFKAGGGWDLFVNLLSKEVRNSARCVVEIYWNKSKVDMPSVVRRGNVFSHDTVPFIPQIGDRMKKFDGKYCHSAKIRGLQVHHGGLFIKSAIFDRWYHPSNNFERPVQRLVTDRLMELKS